jgi:hypothetical protein
MELTDAEREEFRALADATLDAELWDEEELPILRAAKKAAEEEQARESAVLPAEEDPDER